MNDDTAPAPARRPPLDDRDRARLLRSVATLALVGASVVMMLQMFGPWVESFVLSNAVSPKGRRILLLWTGLGGALGVAAAALLYLPRRRAGGLDRLELGARLAAPLTLAALVPPFFVRAGWNDDLLFSLALSALILALEPLVRVQLAAWPKLAGFRGPRKLGGLLARLRARLPASVGRWTPLGLVIAGAIGFGLYVAIFAIRNHRHFNTFDYDLGQLNNEFYNALHGHPFRCTPLIREGNWSELRDHAAFTMYPLLPFYALAPRSETLLAIQAVLVGSGAIPIYRFAARRLSRPLAAVLAFAYLLYPPVHGATFFEMHFQPVAGAFLLWMIDMFDDRRTALFVAFFLLAIGCREDVPVGLCCFGLFLVLTGHRTRAGIWILVVSAVYFVAIRFVIMPLIGPWGFAEIYKDLFPPGESSFGGVVKTMVTNPVFTFRTMLTSDKLRYVLQILTPIAFLPLRRVPLWLAVVPGFFFSVLTTGYGATTNIGYQYSAHFTAYIFPAAALALAWMETTNAVDGRVRRRAAAVALVLATLAMTVRWGGFPPRTSFASGYGTINFKPNTPEELQKDRWLHELVARVPPLAKLAVSDRELPHVSSRLDCYTLMEGYQGSDYILYVPNSGIGRDGDQAARALASGEFVEIDRRPQLSLLKRHGAP